MITVWYVDGQHVEFGAEYEMGVRPQGMLMRNSVTGSMTLTPWGRIDDITATEGELGEMGVVRSQVDTIMRKLVEEA